MNCRVRLRPGSNASYLFVYGTLRRGSRNRFARFLGKHARFAGSARILARREFAGKYLTAVVSKSPEAWLRGEVFRLSSPSKVWPVLDAYEAPDYQRAIITARLADGRCVNTWYYFYQAS